MTSRGRVSYRSRPNRLAMGRLKAKMYPAPSTIPGRAIEPSRSRSPALVNRPGRRWASSRATARPRTAVTVAVMAARLVDSRRGAASPLAPSTWTWP